MEPTSDTALTKDNEQPTNVKGYATTDANANPVTKAKEADAGKKEKSIYRTLSDVDGKTLGRPVTKNLLTIPWWWNLRLAYRFVILLLYIFLTGAQFAFAMAGNSMALTADAVCRMAEIFSHFVSILPYVFPNSRHNFRNQVVASGVSGFVVLGAITVFFVDALEDIYYQKVGTVIAVPLVVFGSLGLFMSLLSLGCYNLQYEKLDKETRSQGSGTYAFIDSVRGIILVIDATLIFFLTDYELQIDAWSTILMCVCMFWAVVNDLCHWKEFATPFTGRRNVPDNGTTFLYLSADGEDHIPKQMGGSSQRATAATSGHKVKEIP
jgi:hypothetical protein